MNHTEFRNSETVTRRGILWGTTWKKQKLILMTGSGTSIVPKVLESQTLGFDNHVTIHRVRSYFSIFKVSSISFITWASRIKISDILQDLDFISEPSQCQIISNLWPGSQAFYLCMSFILIVICMITSLLFNFITY